MKIALFTSVYFNNIGNGFLDLGTEFELKEVIPENAEIVKVSQCSNFAASMGKFYSVKELKILRWIWMTLMKNKKSKQIHNMTYKAVKTTDVFSPAKIFHFDYIVIPGCVLTIHFFKIYGKFLSDKTEQGTKIIFIGVSGNYYTKEEIKYVSMKLEELKPFAIMTRDSIAFKLYKKFTNHSYNGIDNAFYVNKLNIPTLKSELTPYVVINLELAKNKKTKRNLIKKFDGQNMNIIFSDHRPFPYSKVSKMVRKKNTLISDYPLDYLLVYKNASMVYSDRVHACITTLAFGKKAILYSDSPRKAVFQNIGINHTSGDEMSLENLNDFQNKQMNFLKDLFQI